MSDKADVSEHCDHCAKLADVYQSRIVEALAFADSWLSLSEVSIGMVRILRGEPDGIREREKMPPLPRSPRFPGPTGPTVDNHSTFHEPVG